MLNSIFNIIPIYCAIVSHVRKPKHAFSPAKVKCFCKGKLRSLVLSVLLAMAFLPAFSQEGLSINGLFGGPYKNREDAVETFMKGKVLKVYRLTLFRSIKLTPRGNEALSIERRVKADTRNAVDKEVGTIGGRLYYGFYRLRPNGKTNRYIFYRNNALRKGVHPTLTVVYMEGSATIENLKSFFGK